MNGSYNSPFNVTSPKPLPRNYSDVFNAEEYECKESIELESYARNLHNYLNSLLPQTPFPAFLFEKLEKRLDGITCILQKRCQDQNGMNKDKAKQRLLVLSKRLDSTSLEPPSILPPTTPIAMIDEPDHPPKKRRLEAPCVQDVRKALQEQRQQRAEQEKFTINDKEEEEED